MKIIIRSLTEEDHNFIYATYLRNEYFNKKNKTTLKRSTWSSLQHKRLEDILKDPANVRIAGLEDDPTDIKGYTIVDGDRLFTYIKLAWRSPGLKIKERLEEVFK